MRRVITAKVNNTSGVLNRISGVLTRRQFNMDSISVGPTEQAGISLLTLVAQVDSRYESEQLIKQLNKQIDVVKVADITDEAHLERELALVKVSSLPINRSELLALIEPFRGNIIDVAMKSITIQVAGTSEKIDAFVEVVSPYGIQQLARTGVTGITRSK